MKSLESALEVRRRILTAFEAAESERDPDRRAWFTFVVGAGPTGVELAGQIGEIARDTLRRDFRTINTRATRILLVGMVERILPQFPPRLSRRAARALEKLGVTPLTNHTDVDLGEEWVTLAAGTARPSASRRDRSCGPPASSPRSWPIRSRRGRGVGVDPAGASPAARIRR